MVSLEYKRSIEGEGTSELAWQGWLASDVISTRAMHDWMPRGERLVVIAPHPDDEVLACGGLVAIACERGGEVLVIAVTDGEASHPGSSLWNPKTLAAVRRSESVTGLVQLGVTSAAVKRLALPDGAVGQHIEYLAKQLQTLLRPSDWVLTTWRFDGHPDHEATALAASLACCALGCHLIEAPVWMWHWAIPRDRCVPWNHLYRLPLPRAAFERKQAALAAHVSQLDSHMRTDGAVLGQMILARAQRDCEYFFFPAELAHATHR